MVDRPSGTVTFVFTDIEGSTRRWEADPEAMRTCACRKFGRAVWQGLSRNDPEPYDRAFNVDFRPPGVDFSVLGGCHNAWSEAAAEYWAPTGHPRSGTLGDIDRVRSDEHRRARGSVGYDASATSIQLIGPRAQIGIGAHHGPSFSAPGRPSNRPDPRHVREDQCDLHEG